MSLVFETIPTEGIAVLSYLVGDDSQGIAALVDPCADVDRYLELARQKKVAITHIFETHIHADLVSGSCELRDRLGGTAKIFVSCEGGASYDFSHQPLKDGDRFEFGPLFFVGKQRSRQLAGVEENALPGRDRYERPKACGRRPMKGGRNRKFLCGVRTCPWVWVWPSPARRSWLVPTRSSTR